MSAKYGNNNNNSSIVRSEKGLFILYVRQKRRLVFHFQSSTMGKKGEKRPQRGKSINAEDTLHLLDLVEQLKPLANSEWDELATHYNEIGSIIKRNGDTLKKKFYTLARKKPPTGTTQVPSVIKRARYLDKLIDTHHQVGGIEDDVEDEVVVADAGGLPAGDQEDDAKVEANLDNISQSSSGVDDNDDTSEEENEVSITKPTTKATTNTTQPIKRKASYENNDAAVQPISFGKPVVNKKQQNETALD
jgi:hypothetical protein